MSVVIPNYNQTKYLAAAIQSALAQRHRPLEVIVVDDGSTDDCRRAVADFGQSVIYIYQANQGLAGARNTGVLAARGELVGFLDADDQWMPDFLVAMVALLRRDPAASACYGCAQAIDEEGQTLPRVFGGPPVAPDLLRHTLLRANFIIPSTVVIRRQVALSAGLFDANLRSCEDWDLWLRLLPSQRFVGTGDCLALYRLHGNSLSANPDRMLQAALRVVEKHFGPDDEQWHVWRPEKRRAYGGVYRYCALMVINHRDDWATGSLYLRRALRIDASLARDVDLFYELAIGPARPGEHGLHQSQRFRARVDQVLQLVSGMSGGPEKLQLGPLQRDLTGAALHGFGLAAYNTGQNGLGRRLLLGALRHQPALWRDKVVVGDIVKSFIRPLFRRPVAARGCTE